MYLCITESSCWIAGLTQYVNQLYFDWVNKWTMMRWVETKLQAAPWGWSSAISDSLLRLPCEAQAGRLSGRVGPKDPRARQEFDATPFPLPFLWKWSLVFYFQVLEPHCSFFLLLYFSCISHLWSLGSGPELDCLPSGLHPLYLGEINLFVC